jgi:DNA repair protein RadD
MKHGQIRRVLLERTTALLDREVRLPLDPHPYQWDSITAFRDLLADPRGDRRAHIVHATGLGKTVEFCSIIAAVAAALKTGLQILVIVPNKTLVEQTARQIAKFVGRAVGHISSLSKIRDAEDEEVVAVPADETHPILVTTDESFVRRSEWFGKVFRPELIIFDECHWGYTPKVQAALALCKEAFVLGFTATPDYLTTVSKKGSVPVTLDNGRVLYCPKDRFATAHFGRRLDERTLRWGIENRYLAPLAWGMIDFDVSLDEVPVVNTEHGLDYKESALQKLMAKHWATMVEAVRRLYVYNTYGIGERLVFSSCPGVNAAVELAETLSKHDIPTGCITWKTSTTERNRIIRAYAHRDLRHITSVVAIREGWDAPGAEIGLLLRATRSRLMYEQTLGRLERLDKDNPGKVALAVDVHYLQSKLAPLCAPMLFGAPKKGRSSGSKSNGSESDRGHIDTSDPDDVVRDGGIIIGPKEAMSSPYLPKGAKPTLHIVPALTIEYWPDADGFTRVDGEEWGGS